MAGETEQLVVSLEARIRDFERNMQRASAVANTNFRAIENRSRSASRELESSFQRASRSVNAQLSNLGSGALSGLKGQLAGIATAASGALGLNELKKYADGWQQAANKIAAAGEASNKIGFRQSELADLAIRSRADFDTTIDLYTGLKRSTEEMGASQAQVMRVTETVSKAFAVGGQSASTAAGAITQLNQAFASGALRGDELNSVLEGAPPLARLIAKEFGVSVGQLKKLGEEGKLTSDRVFGAILKGSQSVEAEFAKTAPTISQSFNNLTTALTRYFGEADQAYGVSTKVAQGLGAMASNIDTTVGVAAVLGATLAGMFAGPVGAGIAGAATAMALFGDSVKPIAGDLATIGDYARIAFDMAKTAGGEAAAMFSGSFQSVADTVTSILSGAGASTSDLLSAVRTALNAVINAFVNAGDTIRNAWNALGAAVSGAMVAAMNGVIASIEGALNKIVEGVNAVLSTVNGLGSKVGVNIGLGQLATVNLGRVESSYKAAGEAAGKAFEAGSRDYVGDAFAGVEGALQRIRDRANAAAKDRQENQSEVARRNEQLRSQRRMDDGSLTAPLKPLKQDDGGGGGRKGGATKENAFDKAVKDTEGNIARLERERQALSLSAQEAAKAEAAFKLLDAAKQAGIPISDELRSKVDQLADAYANAKVALDQAKQSQQQFRELQTFIGQSLSSFFSDIVSGGKNAKDALMNLVKKLADVALQAALLGSGPLAGLFGTAPAAGSNAVGGLIGAIFKGLGFASGGYTGDGGRDDPAGIVHRGEFVMSKAATQRIGVTNLEALHQGALKGYAGGGLVGAAAIPPLQNLTARGGDVNVGGIKIDIQQQGSSGDAAKDRQNNEDLVKQINEMLDAKITNWATQQGRPGGLLRARR